MVSLLRKRQDRTASTKSQTWPAPVRGWVASGAEFGAPINGADQLDNFFPTAQGARLRRGSELFATVDNVPVRFMPYRSGTASAMFVSTANSVTNITSPIAPDEVETPEISELSSGDWVAVQFATAGGEFMVLVNGTDRMLYYDGSNMNPIVDEVVNNLDYDALTAAFTPGDTVTGGTSGATAKVLAVAPIDATTGTLKVGVITGTFQDDETITDGAGGSATSNIPSGTTSASTVTITGIATENLSSLWQYKERLFFIEKDSLSAWYLPVESIGGAAAELPLGSVFKFGGKLLFGATWSLDSGSGLDDKCIFVTDQGEVAVYEGTNPGDASYWGLVGVYYIGLPLNKHASIQFGGETHIMTDDGIMPLSSAVARGRALALNTSLTFPIYDAWLDTIARQTITYPMMATVWPSEGMLFVGTPDTVGGDPVAFVANVRTRAWCRYRGWDMRCAGVHDDELYFGTGSNEIYKGEKGGQDGVTSYTGYYTGVFSDCGSDGLKFANHLNLIVEAQDTLTFTATVSKDYTPASATAPAAMSAPASTKTHSIWKGVSGSGFAIAPTIAVTSQQTAEPTVRIIATKVRYEAGYPM